MIKILNDGVNIIGYSYYESIEDVNWDYLSNKSMYRWINDGTCTVIYSTKLTTEQLKFFADTVTPFLEESNWNWREFEFLPAIDETTFLFDGFDVGDVILTPYYEEALGKWGTG